VSKYATETLGQLIRKPRLEKRLEQRELARILRVNRNNVCEWENDRNNPSGESIERLVELFRMSRKRLGDLEMEGKKIT
jgi:transcriptional regulator with XRE-family HTH domain